MMCASFSTQQEKQNGFYWDYYVPYFIALKEAGYSNILAHLVYAANEDGTSLKWLKENQKAIDAFFEWSENYEWQRYQ